VLAGWLREGKTENVSVTIVIMNVEHCNLDFGGLGNAYHLPRAVSQTASAVYLLPF
jgi:hypothetical protein